MTWSTKKEETRVITQQTYTKLHDTIPMFLFIGKVSGEDVGMASCSFVYVCCVMILVTSFLVLQAIPISPFLLKK